MTQALILVNGVAASNDSLPINTLVTLQNQGNGGELTYAWTIAYQPPGTADTLTAPTAAVTQITPNKEGNYLIQLVVNAGLPDERVATAIIGVLQMMSQLSQPAAGETTQLGPAGWAVRMNQLVRTVAKVVTDPGRCIVVNTDASPVGTISVISAVGPIKLGYPNAEIVPLTVGLASTTITDPLSGVLYIIEGAVDGGAIGAYTPCYARVYGITSVPTAMIAGAGGVGDPVYVSGSSAYTYVAGARLIGTSMGVDPLNAANTCISVVPAAGGGGGGGGSNVLWEWNRTDVSQFGAKVDLGLGPNIAGLDLTTVAGGPAGTLLRVSSSELDAGGVAWPILQALPRRYVIEIEYWLVQFSDVYGTGNNLGGVVVMADSTLDNVVAFVSLNPTTEDELYLGNFAISSGVPFGPAFHINGSPLGRFQGGPVATPTPTGMRLQYTVEMQRPFSANPRATIRVVGSGYNDAITGAMATETYGNTAGIFGIYPAGWDGLIADTAGLLAGNGGVTTAWSMDIVSMRILKHPADA